MRFVPTPIAGLYAVYGSVHRDERGTFERTWCRESFVRTGLHFSPCQTSLSCNERRLTLRGLHYQAAPAAERKLVRCVAGRVFDVVVDLRQGSPTFLQHWTMVLCAGEGSSIFVPHGCAHGFLTLTDRAVVEYMMDSPHAPEHARGLRWDDPALGVVWPALPEVISERDRSWPDHG